MIFATIFFKIILIVTIINSSYGYKVLGLFIHPGISHFNFYNSIFRGLADAGHDVTLLSHFSDKNAPLNYKFLKLSGEHLRNNVVLNSDSFLNLNVYGEFSIFYNFAYKLGYQSCKNAYNSTAMQHILQSNEIYDVIIMETINTDCMWGVAWHLNAPVISLVPTIITPWQYDQSGSPQITSYMPSIVLPYVEKMTFSERLRNFVSTYAIKFLYNYMIDAYVDDMLKEQFGSKIPSVEELRKNTSLMFVNRHYSLSGSQPLSPALIELGGVQITKLEPIETTIKKILDDAANGVIYVSWGSQVKSDTMTTKLRDDVLRAFGTVNQTVLWKWDADLSSNKPSNVHTGKWFQQKEILCHPNVRVFWTHGGMFSASETAYCGTAVVVTPLFGDQFNTAAAFLNRGMGAVLHYKDINFESIRLALKIALDPVTQENAHTVSYSFKNRIKTPLETAVWWVEHVAATKGARLTKSHSVFLPGYIYHSLDVYAVLAVALLSFVICLVLVCKCAIVKCILKKSDNTKIKKTINKLRSLYF